MLDEKLVFDEKAAVTASRVSTNILDLGAIEEAGRGAPKFVNIEVDAAFDSSANTLAVDLVSDPAVEPDAADVVMGIVPAVAASELTLGKKWKVPLPSEGLARFVGLSYTAAAALSGGSITAYLSLI